MRFPAPFGYNENRPSQQSSIPDTMGEGVHCPREGIWSRSPKVAPDGDIDPAGRDGRFQYTSEGDARLKDVLEGLRSGSRWSYVWDSGEDSSKKGQGIDEGGDKKSDGMTASQPQPKPNRSFAYRKGYRDATIDQVGYIDEATSSPRKPVSRIIFKPRSTRSDSNSSPAVPSPFSDLAKSHPYTTIASIGALSTLTLLGSSYLTYRLTRRVIPFFKQVHNGATSEKPVIARLDELEARMLDNFRTATRDRRIELQGFRREILGELQLLQGSKEVGRVISSVSGNGTGGSGGAAASVGGSIGAAANAGGSGGAPSWRGSGNGAAASWRGSGNGNTASWRGSGNGATTIPGRAVEGEESTIAKKVPTALSASAPIAPAMDEARLAQVLRGAIEDVLDSRSSTITNANTNSNLDTGAITAAVTSALEAPPKGSVLNKDVLHSYLRNAFEVKQQEVENWVRAAILSTFEDPAFKDKLRDTISSLPASTPSSPNPDHHIMSMSDIAEHVKRIQESQTPEEDETHTQAGFYAQIPDSSIHKVAQASKGSTGALSNDDLDVQPKWIHEATSSDKGTDTDVITGYPDKLSFDKGTDANVISSELEKAAETAKRDTIGSVRYDSEPVSPPSHPAKVSKPSKKRISLPTSAFPAPPYRGHVYGVDDSGEWSFVIDWYDPASTIKPREVAKGHAGWREAVVELRHSTASSATNNAWSYWSYSSSAQDRAWRTSVAIFFYPDADLVRLDGGVWRLERQGDRYKIRERVGDAHDAEWDGIGFDKD